MSVPSSISVPGMDNVEVDNQGDILITTIGGDFIEESRYFSIAELEAMIQTAKQHSQAYNAYEISDHNEDIYYEVLETAESIDAMKKIKISNSGETI